MLDLVSLYYPLILLIIIIVTVSFSNFDFKNSHILIIAFDWINSHLPVKINEKYAKIIIIFFLLCIPFSIAATRDYSTFFPTEFSMEVFYDKEGIDEILNIYSNEELTHLKIIKDLSIRDTIYFKLLDEEIRKKNIAESFFTKKDCIIHSNGRTSFEVKKMNLLFQNYKLEESSGDLLHYLECPQEKQVCVKTFFEKLPSKNDYISTSITSITSMIIKPKFKQIIAEENRSNEIRFNHILYGLTKFQIFPMINYDNTLYLYEYNDNLYPIGYAVYK